MGRPKHAIALPDGRTFAEAIRDALTPLCDEIVTLSPEEVLRGHDWIADRTISGGPAAGIDALLAARRANVYVICACDQPFVTTELLERMCAETAQGPAAALKVGDQPSIEHFPLLLFRDAAPIVHAFVKNGRKRIADLLETLGPNIVGIPESRGWQLRNINTPDDL